MTATDATSKSRLSSTFVPPRVTPTTRAEIAVVVVMFGGASDPVALLGHLANRAQELLGHTGEALVAQLVGERQPLVVG